MTDLIDFVDDSIKKIAVVRNDEQRAFIVLDVSFKPG